MPAARYQYTLTMAVSTALLLTLIFGNADAVAADFANTSQRPDIASIVRKIIEVQLQGRAQARPYSVTREYKVFGSDSDRPRTQILAQINFLPPNLKSYDIDQSTGGMGEKVVRRILDHEVDATRDPKLMMVNESNYDFAFVGEEIIDAESCYKLEITPKHDRKELLKAMMWVDKNSYRIIRIEGNPAKSPSFWVKDVHVVIQYAEVAGMWLQTETQALAHLRFGGEYRIVSRDVDYDVARTVAMNSAQPRTHRRHSAAVMAISVR